MQGPPVLADDISRPVHMISAFVDGAVLNHCNCRFVENCVGVS